MKNNIYKLLLCFVSFLFATIVFAQEKLPAAVENASVDVMRSNDKIYVVMAVCITILVAFFLYLVRIDRKVSKLEKNQ